MSPSRTKLVELLILHEGMRLKVYDDETGSELRAGDTTKGHPTIGVGRNIAGDGLGITEDEARMLLLNDINRVEKEIQTWKFMDDLNEARQAVIIDMVFNMGIVRFNSGKWPKFFKAVIAGKWNDAKKEMLDSKWSRQTKTRAQRLARMMETGEWH